MYELTGRFISELYSNLFKNPGENSINYIIFLKNNIISVFKLIHYQINLQKNILFSEKNLD